MTTLTSLLRSALPLMAAAFATAAAPAAQASDFQQYLQGTCNGTICTVDFDTVPAGKKLRVTKSSCYIRAVITDDIPYGVIHALQLLLVKANGSIGMAETMPADLMSVVYLTEGARTVHQSNESMQVTAKAGQHVRAYVELAGGAFEQVACHVSGTLS